jgi:hypothetical protein
MHLSFAYKFFDYHVLANSEKDVVGAIAAEARCRLYTFSIVALISASSPHSGRSHTILGRSSLSSPTRPSANTSAQSRGLPVPSQTHHVAVSISTASASCIPSEQLDFGPRPVPQTAPDGDIAVRTIDSFRIDVLQRSDYRSTSRVAK